MPGTEVFISYASEDRDIAEPIARELTEMGIPTFFDRFSIAVGDSVLESIQRGLASARFGILIVSPHSLKKDWTREEFGQLTRARIEGRTRLLPVWHNVTAEEVREHQPGLEDIWSVRSDIGLRAMVRELAGQIVDATPAVVPIYQRPVNRFLNGEGELTLGVEGPAFTIWEALLSFEPDQFPLYVEGETIDRATMLGRAVEAMARTQSADFIDDQQRETLSALCRAELGFDPKELEG